MLRVRTRVLWKKSYSPPQTMVSTPIPMLNNAFLPPRNCEPATGKRLADGAMDQENLVSGKLG